MSFSRILLLLSVAGLTACSTPRQASNVGAAPNAITGTVHGGQQPIIGASIQLYAVGTIGDGSAATPLLAAAVTTDINGNFSIAGDYSCPTSNPAALVYLVANGGNTGLNSSARNDSLALMTALGACNALNPSAPIVINEVSTVAAVYPLAAFIASYSAVGSGPSDSAAFALAFALTSQLANPANGASPGTNVTPGYSVPVAQINSLADIIAPCVNSDGEVFNNDSPCGKLFALTTPPAGIAPTNTVAALISLAKNPTLNTVSLFNLSSATPPFLPSLTTPPSRFTIQEEPIASNPTNQNSAAIPDVAHLYFDYQMQPSESGNTYLTNYATADGSGIAVGNCPFLASPNAPTWLAETGGISVGGTIASQTYSACLVPTGASNLRTFAVLLTTPIQANFDQPTPTSIMSTTQAGGIGFNNQNGNSGGQAGAYQVAIFHTSGGYGPLTGSNDYAAGRPCIVYTLGSQSDLPQTYDSIYINGNSVGSYTYQAQQFGEMTTGQFQLGGTSSMYEVANIYRAMAWSTALTPAQALATCQLLEKDANSRGVFFPASVNGFATNQIIGFGDSIMCADETASPCGAGTVGATSSLGQLSGLVNIYAVTNLGVSGTSVYTSAAQSLIALPGLCATEAAQNIILDEAAHNDLAYFGGDAQAVWAENVALLKNQRSALESSGCQAKIGITTVISGTNIDPTGNNSRDPYNALVRQQWQQAGFDFLNDWAEDPVMGCDGCSVTNSPAYFNVDNTHPTAAGQLRLAKISSDNINRAYVIQSPVPTNLSTAATATYTQTATDLLTVVDASKANGTINLMTCVGSDVPITVERQDLNGTAYTVTLVPAFGDQINQNSGRSYALHAGQSVTFQPVAQPASTAGCSWQPL